MIAFLVRHRIDGIERKGAMDEYLTENEEDGVQAETSTRARRKPMLNDASPAKKPDAQKEKGGKDGKAAKAAKGKGKGKGKKAVAAVRDDSAEDEMDESEQEEESAEESEEESEEDEYYLEKFSQLKSVCGWSCQSGNFTSASTGLVHAWVYYRPGITDMSGVENEHYFLDDRMMLKFAKVSLKPVLSRFGRGSSPSAPHPHHSPPTTHHSPLTAHRSPLTTHHSRLTTQHSTHTTHHQYTDLPIHPPRSTASTGRRGSAT